MVERISSLEKEVDSSASKISESSDELRKRKYIVCLYNFGIFVTILLLWLVYTRNVMQIF